MVEPGTVIPPRYLGGVATLKIPKRSSLCQSHASWFSTAPGAGKGESRIEAARRFLIVRKRLLSQSSENLNFPNTHNPSLFGLFFIRLLSETTALHYMLLKEQTLTQ